MLDFAKVRLSNNDERRTFMSNSTQPALPSAPRYQLIRKQRLLQKIPQSKSTLHAKLDPDSRYYDATLPRPIYFPGSQIPYWDEAAVDVWIAKSIGHLNAAQAVIAPDLACSPRIRSTNAAKRGGK